MPKKLRSRLSYANVMATVAVFIALGGTTYAATGGNFILGQTNTASTSTQLSSGAAASALKVSNTGSGRSVAGFSNSGQGIYGHSNGNAGVVGEGASFDGVYGVSNSQSAAGVSGHNDAGGWGVWASGGDVANSTAGIHGQSGAGNAVEGISGSNVASGVYGQNNGTGFGTAGRSTNGIGVLGESSNGWALNASGNTTQSRTGSGLVKAMAYVDPGNHPSDPIQRCFNSQLPASQATNGNCGITYSTGAMATGDYVLDFGFQVDDRLVLLTTSSVGLSGEWRRTLSVRGGTTNRDLRVWAYDTKTDSFETTPFFIFVF